MYMFNSTTPPLPHHYYHVVLSSLIANMAQNMPLFVQQLRFLFFVFCPFLPLYNSYYHARAEVQETSTPTSPA
jgi:hypothetical protein